MAFRIKKFLSFLICAITLIGMVYPVLASQIEDSTVRIGIFGSQKQVQKFFEAFPARLRNTIDPNQLWLNAFQSPSGFTEHHLEISGLSFKESENICTYVHHKDNQCLISKRRKWNPLSDTNLTNQQERTSTNKSFVANNLNTQNLPKILRPLGLRITREAPDIQNLDLAYKDMKQYDVGTFQQSVKAYSDDFTLESKTLNTPEAQAALAAYRTARDQFLSTLQNVGEGINAGENRDAVLTKLIALGEQAFEAAGSTYLAGFLEQEFGFADALASDAGAGDTFIHHVKKNLSVSAQSTVKKIVRTALDGTTDMTATADALMASGARSVIDAGLAAARRSDLYALRNLELEYNINNFENSYMSAIITQPIYQSADLRHNVFLQGGGILNEQSVDIDDDVSRHTLNMGAAYRYLSPDEKYLLGGNIFYDHQWPYNHSRLGLGVDAKSKDLNFAANYYHPLSGYKDSRRDGQGSEYEERALKGFDAEVGYNPPFVKGLGVFAKGYQYMRDTDDDIQGVELSAEYNVLDNFTLKGSLIEENGGRDGVQLALQYRVPLYDTKKSNLALADMEPAAGNSSVKGRIFEKVRRSNTIRVEERLKETTTSNEIITAQFNAASTGLPYDVGGNPTGANVNLPFNTVITVPNTRFGIINFSNGAIANVSASGGGPVTLQFNETALSVIATNGGFVQFISGSGGISVVNVPGGTVNLLGTDIDVTDDGATTTIQVRAGEINVVPDVGVDAEDGDQGDVVNLVQATGATTKLAGAALETRQEAAFTNLDLINPAPPMGSEAAPFVNKAPELITGPSVIGDNADIRLTFTQSVTVTGSPQITGFVDANMRNFIYNAAASSPTELVFRHTFIAADAGAAGVTLDELDLNGGTIIGSSNALNAITAFTTTVLPINDITGPTFTGSTPADGTVAFNAANNIVLNFNENVQANIGNILITDTDDGSGNLIIPITDAQVTVATNTVTINPTGVLEQGTNYQVTIGSNVIQDASGNAFAGLGAGDLNFTTDTDLVGPVFTGSTPVDNATGIARNSNIVLNFDENVVLSGTINLVDTDDASGNIAYTAASPEVTVSGSMITINPATNLEYAENYEITYALGAVEDLFGNDAAALNSGDLNFKTIDLEETLALTLHITAADQVDDQNIQGSGVDIGLAGTFVMAMDITIPGAPSGLLFECGGGGQGQYVGFNSGSSVLRFRGGDGGAAPPQPDMASLDVPFASITAGSYTLTFEYEFATAQIRAWLDENLLGSATPSGGTLDTNRWQGGDQCTFYDTSTSSLTTGEIATRFNGSLDNPNIRFYQNQTVP